MAKFEQQNFATLKKKKGKILLLLKEIKFEIFAIYGAYRQYVRVKK